MAHFLPLLLGCRQKADFLVNLVQGALGDGAGLLGALAVAAFQIALIRHQAFVLLADGAQLLGHRLADGHFEVAVAVARKLLLNLVEALAGDGA